MKNQELTDFLNQLLQADAYSDYAPNGLQVEGKSTIQTVVTGVTASMTLIEKAIECDADALIVHHGYFWKGEHPEITGMKQRRLKALLDKDINLYAYHLPLDGHIELGNNAQLGKLWGVTEARQTEVDLLWQGQLPEVALSELETLITDSLSRQPLVISGGKHPIKTLMWCSGGAQQMIEKAALLGADAFISGEVSEQTYHQAKEYGIHYIAAGHHATERCGINALTDYLNENTTLSCRFIDCYNPV